MAALREPKSAGRIEREKGGTSSAIASGKEGGSVKEQSGRVLRKSKKDSCKVSQRKTRKNFGDRI